MPFEENTHVTFTSGTGAGEVGVVQSYSGGQYSIQKKDGSTETVAEANVSKLAVTSANADACPVVGHGK